MEKKNYLKPDFALNNIKATSFIAASVEAGEGGTSCVDELSEKVIEDIFFVNTNYSGYGDGPFLLSEFKEYIRIKNSANIQCNYLVNDNELTGIDVKKQGNKTILNIGGMSFEKGACYTATLIDNECIQFTPTRRGTCNNYNFNVPK